MMKAKAVGNIRELEIRIKYLKNQLKMAEDELAYWEKVLTDL